MAALRRSSRLSSISKITTPKSPKKSRHSEIWRRRQSTDDIFDSENEETELKLDVNKTRTKYENNENYNAINKINKIQQEIQTNKVKYTILEEAMFTPHRKKRNNRPMPANKKRELLKRFSSIRTSSESEAENHHHDEQVSPPKISRQQQQQQNEPVAKHLISPTRLMDRLSIEERPSESENISDDSTDDENVAEKTGSLSKIQLDNEDQFLTTRSKYQNARRVLNSAETENLPGREEQLEELRNFFLTHINKQRSGSLYVSGQPGTGKTACLSMLLRSSEFAKRLHSIYINCTSVGSVSGVYKKICNELNLQANGRCERDYIFAIVNHLRSTKRITLIVLDEIDQLCSSRQSVLYTIFEWPALANVKILLVGIANSLDLTDRALMRLNARCELKPRLLHFPPYTKQQIIDIFKSRLEEANVLDVFPNASLQLLAAKVSAVSGDVRRALDIGRRVIEITEQQKKTGAKEIDLAAMFDFEKNSYKKTETEETNFTPVQITHVASVLNKIYGASQNLQDDIEESFPLQQKIMLCVLMLMLRNEKNKDISIGRLHEVYRRVCNKRNLLALDQSEFTNLVNLVETRGILRLMRKKEPRLSRVQLHWDEDEVNNALKDKQLIASILNDVSCLNSYK